MTSVNETPNVSAPEPLDWRELIAGARDSIGDQLPESRATSHRAISTAYYAGYDTLCTSNAEVLVPVVADQVGIDAWVRVYRGSSHGHAIRNLKRHLTSLSPDGQNFATTLEALYEARLRADYNPTIVFDRQDAEYYLNPAEAAIARFVQLPQSERVAIATITLLRDR